MDYGIKQISVKMFWPPRYTFLQLPVVRERAGALNALNLRRPTRED